MGAMLLWKLRKVIIRRLRHEFRFRVKVLKTWKRLHIMMHKFFIRPELLSHHTQKKHPMSGIKRIFMRSTIVIVFSLDRNACIIWFGIVSWAWTQNNRVNLSAELQQWWLWIISKYSRIYSWLVNILICKLIPATSCPW